MFTSEGKIIFLLKIRKGFPHFFTSQGSPSSQAPLPLPGSKIRKSLTISAGHLSDERILWQIPVLTTTGNSPTSPYSKVKRFILKSCLSLFKLDFKKVSCFLLVQRRYINFLFKIRLIFNVHMCVCVYSINGCVVSVFPIFCTFFHNLPKLSMNWPFAAFKFTILNYVDFRFE